MVLMAREVIKYSLVSGAEQAVTGYVWLGATTVQADLVSAINANQNALWEAWRAHVPTQHSLVERRLEILDPATGVVEDAVSLNTPTNPAGSNIDGCLPLQVSMVMTFRPSGIGSRALGRIYLPPLNKQTITATGLVQTTPKEDIVDGHAAYFAAVETACSAGIGVWSRTNLTWASAASIDMGSVPDTQRRRRASLVESRYSVTI